MRRLAFSVVVASLWVSQGTRARAAGECPDGDWFCEQAPPAAPTPGAHPAPGPAESAAGEPPTAAASPAPVSASPLHEAGASSHDRRIRIDVPRVRPAQPRHRLGFREWGLSLHASVGLLGSDRAMSPDAGMNGFGAAFRFRPIPHVAVEGALEVLWGTDYNGFPRFEEALLVNGLFFVNPRHAVQLYGLAGFGTGEAFIDSERSPGGQRLLPDERYSYLGAQLGVGVEGRVTPHFALGADLMGFLRGRIDRHAAANPEFVDPDTQRTTNTSGGGLLRLGATFYW